MLSDPYHKTQLVLSSIGNDISKYTKFTFFVSCTYLFDFNMDTYIINKILFSDDYLAINQITIEPILRKLLMVRM